jgi:hypothetical protein
MKTPLKPGRPAPGTWPASSPPAALIDLLNALLESQQNSIIRFMGESSPYLGGAPPGVRQLLAQMLKDNLKRSQDLYRLIERLGGSPRPRGLQPEEQYLSYLSLKFLLPKIVDAKELIIRRYENALLALQNGQALQNAPADVFEMLQQQLAEHRKELENLRAGTAAR